MASEEAPSDAPTAQTEVPTDVDTAREEPTVNLNILSPSTAATNGGPLRFPGLAATTTIRQLKEKIRQALPLKPSDEQQRLIFKGRPLQQEDDTLRYLIGEDTLREHNQQTMHLVLRGFPEVQVPSQPAVRGRSPADERRPFLPTAHARPLSPQTNGFGSNPPPGSARRTVGGRDTFPGMGVPHAPSFTPHQMQQMQSQLQQSITAWNNGLQREALNRATVNQQINQNQAARASMGMHGIGDNGSPVPGANPADATRGRASPGPPGPYPYTRTTVREGTLSDGQPYRVTNTETWTPLSATEVQNILRGGDAGQATQAMTQAMQRSDSGASHGAGGPAPGVGVTTPFYPSMGSRAGSRRGTPDPNSRSVSGGSANANANASGNVVPRSSPPTTPEVYILSSPEGPRGLLINNNSDTYYTPAMRTPSGLQAAPLSAPSRYHQPTPFQLRSFAPPPSQQDHPHSAQPRIVPQEQHQQQPQVQPQVQPQPQDRAPQVAPVGAHPNNPAVAPLFAQMFQHFWLLIRLSIFIWWFTSANSSWSRWATVLAIAATIFLVNTGLLDGFFQQAAGPVRRHMDNLIPLAGPINHGQNAHGAAPENDGPIPGEAAAAAATATQNNPAVAAAAPEPAQVAARLVAQRRQDNANWLMGQVRRIERAGLLFLASIAPGVAERHIAHLEAEARAEQRRREEADAAAAAAAATEDANGQEQQQQQQDRQQVQDANGDGVVGQDSANAARTIDGGNVAQEREGAEERPAEQGRPLVVL